MAKSVLLPMLGRRARLMDHVTLASLLKNFDRHSISQLRNEHPERFGIGRLIYAAEQLGLDVEICITDREAP